MSSDTPFQELILRVRSGSEEAAAELIRTHGAEVRTCIRHRILYTRLCRFLDISDIFQSVFASFFVRVMSGQFDLDEPEQLTHLLAVMARNKIKDHARKASNRRQVEVDSGQFDTMEYPGESPSDIVAIGELCERAHGLLTQEERAIADLRMRGLKWPEVGAALLRPADTVRKQLAAAMNRVCRKLGLETDDDDSTA